MNMMMAAIGLGMWLYAGLVDSRKGNNDMFFMGAFGSGLLFLLSLVLKA